MQIDNHGTIGLRITCRPVNIHQERCLRRSTREDANVGAIRYIAGLRHLWEDLVNITGLRGQRVDRKDQQE